MQKVTKAANPPRVSFVYNDDDIVTQIRSDFFDMCYLCEEVVIKHHQIEHFFPQVPYKHLENDWDNLFLICSKCNTVRPKKINTCSAYNSTAPHLSEINNCVLSSTIDDVEAIIQLEYDMKNDRVNISIDSNGLTSEKINQAKNTVVLLERIYNGEGGTTSKQYLDLRSDIKEKIANFISDVEILKNITPSLISTKQAKLERHLNKTSRKVESSYFSFKRTIVRNDPGLNHLIGYIH